MDNFFSELDKIIRKLDSLESYTDISDEYLGDSFPDQNKFAVELENLIMAATHETASQLAFLKEDISKLIRFIQFRNKYEMLSNADFIEIIDNKVSDVKFRMELKNRISEGNPKELCDNVEAEWNSIFKESYKKLSNKFSKT